MQIRNMVPIKFIQLLPEMIASQVETQMTRLAVEMVTILSTVGMAMTH